MKRPGAVFVSHVLFDKPEFDWRTQETIFFADSAVHVAFVAPMQKLRVRTKYFKARVGIIIFLDDVIELWSAVFEPGWWMGVGDSGQPAVEFGGFNNGMATLVDLECKVEEFGDILSGYRAGENEWRPRHKFKIMLDARNHTVMSKFILIYTIPFADD